MIYLIKIHYWLLEIAADYFHIENCCHHTAVVDVCRHVSGYLPLCLIQDQTKIHRRKFVYQSR